MYSIDQSPLYKLRNKRKLSSFFNLKLCDLNKLLSKGSDNYRVFYIKKLGKKPRQVQAPKPILKRIHKRLFELLKRIEIPNYMYSGMKGRSYIDNAKSHIGIEPLIKLDISNFFPSTKRHHIYDFFYDVMKCEKDVAGLLANISSVDGKLPTGSCLSQILAYYSHKKMFDDLSELANRNNLNISVYVDDIAISGRKASNRVMYEAIKIIKKSGLKTRRSKVRRYKRGEPKLVTGVIVTESSIKLPNSRHLKLHQIKKTLLRELRSKTPVKNINSFNGMIVSAQQIDPQLQFKRIK